VDLLISRKNGEWILENLTDKDHIRGAFKAYQKACFKQMGGLKAAMDGTPWTNCCLHFMDGK
jgi:hypothetical protein